MSETLSDHDNIEIINRDILKTDVNGIIEKSRQAGEFSGKVRIIGNLPYYITTAIIMKLLEEKTEAESITIMMQKEVADRIKASPGGKTYGALSVAVQYYCEVEQVISVPKEVFVPKPKVDSAVLNLRIRKEKPVTLTDEKAFFCMYKIRLRAEEKDSAQFSYGSLRTFKGKGGTGALRFGGSIR